MQIGRFTIALLALAALNACELNRDDSAGAPNPDPAAAPGSEAGSEPTSEPSEAVSILRADIEQPELPAAPLEPLNTIIGFPDGGSDLDAEALLELQKVIISEQLELGGPITLRGHSDAGGSDAVNERASRARAEQVRDWLIGKDIAETRITIIAFGEQNPVEPNALPDGTPNEEGRALNRRVEVLIVPPAQTGQAAEAAPAAQ